VVGGLAVLCAVPLLGAALAWPLRPAPDRDGRTETVAVIQGGLPDLALDFESRAEQVLDNHVRQTLRLAARIDAGRAPRPDLVIWPENASDVDPFLVPGASLHEELSRLVAVGFTPLEAITAATRHASQVLAADSIGMVAAGRVADLVVLNRNPAEDITATRDIAWVMVRGRMFRPDSLRNAWTK